uniref:Secreted protein n=1 Tax=Opuntia streptacantha TaxID=393608 RepID=A0A7C9ENK6_OPUST
MPTLGGGHALLLLLCNPFLTSRRWLRGCYLLDAWTRPNQQGIDTHPSWSKGGGHMPLQGALHQTHRHQTHKWPCLCGSTQGQCSPWCHAHPPSLHTRSSHGLRHEPSQSHPSRR